MVRKPWSIHGCVIRILRETMVVKKRQREVIQKIMEKVLSLNSISHYQAILKALSDNMQTNVDLSASSIPQLLGYQDSFKNIETHQCVGKMLSCRNLLSNRNDGAYAGNAKSLASFPRERGCGRVGDQRCSVRASLWSNSAFNKYFRRRIRIK